MGIQYSCEISCSLCESEIKRNNKVENQILYEDDSFFLVPCIGPLTNGHIMIVTKEHNYLSFADLPCDKYERFVEIVSNMRARFRGKLLLAEHGSFIGHTGGKCITHAHVHLIPYEHETNLLDDYLSKIFVKKLESLPSVINNQPYILLENGNTISLYSAYNIKSQLIRILIKEKLNDLDKWNWRQSRNEPLILKSVELWKKILI